MANTVCSMTACPNLVPVNHGTGYCQEHLGDGAILDELHNLDALLRQVVDGLETVAATIMLSSPRE